MYRPTSKVGCRFLRNRRNLIKRRPLLYSKRYLTQRTKTTRMSSGGKQPQYGALYGRECKVIQETGIVLYEPSTSSTPVSQFVGCQPMNSERNTISVKILKTGKKGEIGIGLVPKDYPATRMPGWNRHSIGYHADNGGIYLESGQSYRLTKQASVGDVMSFHLDMDTNKGFFKKNGEKCIELNLNPSVLGYYPCIAMNSIGEAVQILEKSCWEPDGSAKATMESLDFGICKYSNCWISPKKNVVARNILGRAHGWLIIHNPSDTSIAFKIVYGRKSEQKCYGVIQPKENHLENLGITCADVRDTIYIEWIKLGSSRAYETSELKDILGETEKVTNKSSCQHKLSVTIDGSSSSQQKTTPRSTRYKVLFEREAKIIHETGTLLYDTNSSSVAQFVGCRPMTKEHNNFSIKILKTGQKGFIGIGLVPKDYPPNRMPGWNLKSIGYHADDGGVYIESGKAIRITKTAAVGDVISLYIDFDNNKGFFRKNGEKCLELNLNPASLGFYPCIGMHSSGEAVQIMEKVFWEPEGTSVTAQTPSSLSTYKYPNLWISPLENLSMRQQQNAYSGWLVLHNPCKSQIGFKVVYGKLAEQRLYGVLEAGVNQPELLKVTNDDIKDTILIEWIALESGRQYDKSDLKQLLGDTEKKVNQNSQQHKLQVLAEKIEREETRPPVQTTTETAKPTPTKTGRVDEKSEEKKDSGLLDAFIVAAIDFGTTYSGYAFSFKHDYDKDPTQISTFAWPGARCLMSLKTSTCILFDPDQNFASFGYEAEDQYSELAGDGDDEHKDWYYFRRFKMQLFDNKELKKSFMIKDETGKPMEARKVFGAGIKYLKEHLITKVKRTLPETREEDIRFVLTVPAIWNEGAKLFMREAAKVAGIIPDRLLIALEPEAASIYCKHIDLANFSGVGANFKPFAAGSRYVILDAGGGTIDITVHEVQSDGHLKELYNANGGAWGGAFVDKCFEDFLREVTGDDVIEQFKTEHVGEYLDIFKEFEVKKREIKDGMRDRMQIKLDSNIPRIYKSKRNNDLQKSIKEDPNYGVTGMADWMGDKMRVKKQVCFKFFEKALESIGDHLEELMKKPECNGADTILMVGGFSESPLLQEYVIKRFSKKRVIVPEGAGMSVLKGAVIFGHDPTAISERKCRYTYGCEMYQTFNEKIHDPKRKVLSNEGVANCKEVFSVHVKKNTVVKCGEYQVEKDYVPFQGDRERLTFQLYASEIDNPKYINDSGCFHLGQISIVLPEGATKDEKKIKLKLKFGTTNLEATATAVKTGKSVTASFELSS